MLEEHEINQNGKNNNVRNQNNDLDSCQESSINDCKKMYSFNLNLKTNKNQKLNNDIIHLLEFEKKNLTTKNNNKALNNSIYNRNDALPSIKTNNQLLDNSSTILDTYQINNVEGNKNQSVSISPNKEKKGQNNLRQLKFVTNKGNTISKINNHSISTPNFKVNDKIIKRNDSNLVNEITTEDTKKSVCPKLIMVKKINKKNNINIDLTSKIYKIKDYLMKNMPLFKLSKLYPKLIDHSLHDMIKNKIINESIIEESKINSNKSMNGSVAKLNGYYYDAQSKSIKKKSKENDIKLIPQKKKANNSIKKEIFYYNELFLKKQRLKTLQKIKQKNKLMNDFKNNINIVLKNEKIKEKFKEKIKEKNKENDNLLFSQLIKKQYNDKITKFQEKIKENNYRNNIKILKNAINKERRKNRRIDELFNYNINKNEVNNYHSYIYQKIDSLIRKERIELYSI